MIILLLLFWIILSAEISMFFVVSAILAVAMAIFIDKKLFFISPLWIGIKWSWIVFIGSLLKEMFISSIKLIKIIWFSPKQVEPCCISIDAQSEEKTSQAVQANSITLTPGTMAMQLQDGKILVHAINTEMMQELQQDKTKEQNT